ncbi:uncharacterized protein N7515_000070 [Penicillium bovifimosum]|uniref:Uncharacterized protein n=1 Tax=Penicillium bovifimosum TaxID=126998 RepID=A0A9W9HEC3_9EURO|nr:uncharacterized protein N7515_000070 [Penicillium bovifimosum]KAJ5145506.1 hypothetical protein N7515_000070 [Penicillium bovifimosum]
MDILGICFLAFGAGSSMTYYAFYCRPLLRLMYWALNLFSAIGAGITLFDTGGGGNKMRTLRGAVFFFTCCFGHDACFALGWMRAKEIGAGWYLAEGIALLIGGGFLRGCILGGLMFGGIRIRFGMFVR